MFGIHTLRNIWALEFFLGIDSGYRGSGPCDKTREESFLSHSSFEDDPDEGEITGYIQYDPKTGEITIHHAAEKTDDPSAG